MLDIKIVTQGKDLIFHSSLLGLIGNKLCKVTSQPCHLTPLGIYFFSYRSVFFFIFIFPINTRKLLQNCGWYLSR